MTMKEFTGYEYLLIDIANNNHLGGDKARFEERIAWTTSAMDELEEVAELNQWKERPLYLKAVQALRKAQAGLPSGHLVGMDAAASGMQIMSALTGCVAGARATGLVDPDVRSDAYQICTDIMSAKLGKQIPNARKSVKNAVMTSLYGSKEEPKNEFGDDTPELNAFQEALFEMAPGACDLLGDLVDSWQPWTKCHAWILPDGFQAKVKTTRKIEDVKIEIDELDHATFGYEYFVNEGDRRGVKNAANVIHSIDAYTLRTLVRRCNYDLDEVSNAAALIQIELLERQISSDAGPDSQQPVEITYYRKQYHRSNMPDLAILPYLDSASLKHLTCQHLIQLKRILTSMLCHRPFEVITIHDDFKAHPNNLNHVRSHYREILAELADSDLMQDILNQIHGSKGNFQKVTPDLSTKIRQSNYALS